MIRIIINFVLFMLTLSLFAQENGVNINVKINSFTNDNGIAAFSLFTEKSFLEKPIKQIKTTIKNGKANVTFKNVPQGTYAIICLHDVNENDKIDYNEMGMPLEDIGVSNTYINFGPPKFKKAKFDVEKENLTITIKF